MNKEFLQKNFLVPIIIVGILLLGSIGYLLYSIFGHHGDSTTGVATSPGAQTNNNGDTSVIKPKVVRIDLSSSAGKNNTTYNAEEQTGLSENQAVNIVREQFVTFPSEYDLAFGKVEVKDGKKYDVVKIFIKDEPDIVTNWVYVDPTTKKAYMLHENENKLYPMKR